MIKFCLILNVSTRMHKCMCYMFFFLNNNNLTNYLYFYNKNLV